MTRKLSVLIGADWWAAGGIESFTARLARGLADFVNLTFFVARAAGAPPVPFSGARTVEVPLGVSRRRIIDLVTAVAPAIVHVHNPSWSGFWLNAVARRIGAATVFTCHQVPEYKTIPLVLKPALRKLLSVYVNRFDAVTAPSHFVASLLARYGVRRPITVVSCGVDTRRFTPGDRRIARALLNLPGGPLILFIGRYDPGKDLETALAAFARITPRFPDAHFVLVGDAQGRGGTLRVLADSLGIAGQVRFVGRIPSESEELVAYYRAADIFVMPSLFETQSIVTLEAMACGLPIVAADGSALVELVHDGENGFVVPHGNFNAFADAMVNMLEREDTRVEFGVASRRRALEHDFHSVVEGFIELYRILRPQNHA